MSAWISGCGSPMLHGGRTPCNSSGLAPVGLFEHLLSRGVVVIPRSINLLIYVNILDMSESFEDQPLGYLLHRVHDALRSEVTATVLDPLDLAFPRIHLHADAVAITRDRSNAELARDTNVSPQAMNMVLRGLEERGLVDAAGQRGVGAVAARPADPRGAELLKRTDAGVRAAENRLMVNMTDEERDQFKRTLAALGSDPI